MSLFLESSGKGKFSSSASEARRRISFILMIYATIIIYLCNHHHHHHPCLRRQGSHQEFWFGGIAQGVMGQKSPQWEPGTKSPRRGSSLQRHCWHIFTAEMITHNSPHDSWPVCFTVQRNVTFCRFSLPNPCLAGNATACHPCPCHHHPQHHSTITVLFYTHWHWHPTLQFDFSITCVTSTTITAGMIQ